MLGSSVMRMTGSTKTVGSITSQLSGVKMKHERN